MESATALTAAITELESTRPAGRVSRAPDRELALLLREYTTWLVLLAQPATAHELAAFQLRLGSADHLDAAIAEGVKDDTDPTAERSDDLSDRVSEAAAYIRRRLADRLLPYDSTQIQRFPILMEVEQLQAGLRRGAPARAMLAIAESILATPPAAGPGPVVDLDVRLLAADLAARSGDLTRATDHLVRLAATQRNHITPLEHIELIRADVLVALPELRRILLAGDLLRRVEVDTSRLSPSISKLTDAVAARLNSATPKRRPRRSTRTLIVELARLTHTSTPRLKPASAATVNALQDRIGSALPPSYGAFFGVTDGLHPLPSGGRLLPAAEVGWFRDLRSADLALWMDASGDEWVDDADYDVYGSQQDPAMFRPEYLHSALLIGDGVAPYLLIPSVQRAPGEWEAWYMPPQIGAVRYPSFRDFLEAELELGLEASDHSPP
jgi:hypothetical protein